MGYEGYYFSNEKLSNAVLIHDDIVQYIQDTLNWIPSINPAMNYEKGLGLNNYGITLFDKEGAEVIVGLAKSWADLFSRGPSTLKLTGNYCFTGNDRSYEIIEISRDKLVESFRKLQLFSERVISNKYLILHYGL
ncbi:MAG: hypothetical protein E7211_09150 [Clostridium lundense]|nr:hypothetical protein [Clostridium lundense]